MTSSHFFKVMIIQRQITWKWYNGTTYNGRPIESRIWSIEERHIQWHWTTPTQFQGHAISWRWISQKRYDIQTQCHWNTNRDLPTPYTTVSFRMILSDIEWLSKIFNDTKRRAVSLRQLSFSFVNWGCHICFLAWKAIPPVNNFPHWNLCCQPAAANTDVPYASFPAKNSPPPREFTVATICTLLTRDLFAIAKLFGSSSPPAGSRNIRLLHIVLHLSYWYVTEAEAVKAQIWWKCVPWGRGMSVRPTSRWPGHFDSSVVLTQGNNFVLSSFVRSTRHLSALTGCGSRSAYTV